MQKSIKVHLLPDLQTSGVISSSGCSMLNIVGKGSLVINKHTNNYQQDNPGAKQAARNLLLPLEYEIPHRLMFEHLVPNL